MINFSGASKYRVPNQESSNENFHDSQEPNRISFDDTEAQPIERFNLATQIHEFKDPDEKVDLYTDSNLKKFRKIADVLSNKDGYLNLSGKQESKLPQFSQIKNFFDRLSLNPLAKSQNESSTSTSGYNKYRKFMSGNCRNNEFMLDWILGKDADQNWWIEFAESLDSQPISISQDNQSDVSADKISNEYDQAPKLNRSSFSEPAPAFLTTVSINKQSSQRNINLTELYVPERPRIKRQPRKYGRSLPPRIIANITKYLTLKESIKFLSLKRSWFLSFLSSEGSYRNIFWRLMLARIGFSSTILKIKGQEKSVLLNIPSCMWSVLSNKFGIDSANGLEEIVSFDPFLLFSHIFKEFCQDYMLFFNSSKELDILLKFAITSREKTKLCQFAERLEQLLWFGRGRFYQNYKQINWNLYITASHFESSWLSILNKAIEIGEFETAHVYALVLSKYNNGLLYVNKYLESNPLVVQIANSDKLNFDNNSVFDLLKYDGDLGRQRAYVRWKSGNIKDTLELKTLFIVITDLLYKEFRLQEMRLGSKENEALIRTTIGALLDQMLKANGIIGASFRNVFEAQRKDSKNSVAFLKAVSESFKVFLKYINTWDQFFYAPQKSTKAAEPTLKNTVEYQCRNFYSLVPKSIPLHSVFTVLSKGQLLDYFGDERQSIKDGMHEALDWFRSGMPDVSRKSASTSTSNQQVFFTNEVIDIINNSIMSFRSPILEKLNSGQNNLKAGVNSSNVNSFPVSPSLADSTKFIKLFNFSDHSEAIEVYKIKVNNVFLRVFGFEISNASSNPTPSYIISEQADFSLKSAEKIISGKESELKPQLQLSEDINDPTSAFEGSTFEASETRNTSAETITDPKIKFINSVAISVPLCVGMIYFINASIDRVLLFLNTPSDSFIYKNAYKEVEHTFCELLKNLGQNHIKPAFENIIRDLQKLQSQIGSISGLVAAVKMATSQRNVPQFEYLNSKNQGRLSTQHRGSITQSANQPTSSTTLSSKVSKTVNFSSISLDFAFSANESLMEQQMRELVSVLELKFFELVHFSDLVLQLVNEYFEIKMNQFIDKSDFLNPMNIQKRALNSLMDDCVATGVDAIIEIIIRQLEHVLSVEQKEEDYYPKQTVSLQLKPTMACVHCVQLLDEASEIIKSLSKAQKIVCDVYMSEIGNRLFSLLRKHLFQFTISEPGGFQLIADLNLYYDWAVSSLDDQDTLQLFTTLKDLANCFIIAPKDLRGFLRELYSRRAFDNVMRSEEVYDIVARRADYKKIRGQVEGNCDFM